MFEFCLKVFRSSLTHWGKCTYGELRNFLGFLQKISWCAKGGHQQHLFQQYDFPFNVHKSVANNNLKGQALLTDQNRGKP